MSQSKQAILRIDELQGQMKPIPNKYNHNVRQLICQSVLNVPKQTVQTVNLNST